jgi:hypothetical protein
MKIQWDDTATTPAEKPPVVVITGITGEANKAQTEEKGWSVDELKAGKPMLVYYFVAETKNTEDNFKFSRKTEFSAFSNDAIERINKNFVPKKVEIDADADRKLEKNQSRIEFWSFTGKRIDAVGAKNQQVLNPSDFVAKLKEVETKNRDLCNAEIKRLQAEQDRKKKETAAAGK